MMNMERSEMNMLPIEGEKGEIILYQPDDNICLEVRLENETVWLSTSQMSVLFGREESNIRRHIQNVFKDGELQSENNVHFLHVNGVKKPVPYYNLDVIISVGYRVHSQLSRGEDGMARCWNCQNCKKAQEVIVTIWSI